MTLNTLWDLWQAEGYDAVCAAPLTDPLDHFYRALLAFGTDDFAQAAADARAAAALNPDSLVYAHATTYLERVLAQGKTNVYVDGTAFAAFIRGGGNVGLYTSTSAALRSVYERHSALHLLDIGVGDGMALLPALTGSVRQVDLVEPSEAMLAHTTQALAEQGIAHQAANQTVQAFMEQEQGRWDVIQATYSLQSVPPTERGAVFEWLRVHGDQVLIAEFDVPAFTGTFAPDHVQYVVARFERGLGEYEGDLVAQGFLMPVMFGYFDQSAARTNWEEPIQNWCTALRAAGFEQVQTTRLFEYFWADAYLINAR